MTPFLTGPANRDFSSTRTSTVRATSTSYYRAIGVTHLLWRPGSRPSPTKQEEVLFSDFAHRFGKGARKFGDETLAALPDAPPPTDHPYRVLMLGLRGYADGVYPIEAMNTYESIPNMTEVFAPPEVPLPGHPAAQGQLAAGVDAVCIDTHFVPSAALLESLLVSFESVVTYPNDFSVLVPGPAARPQGP